MAGVTGIQGSEAVRVKRVLMSAIIELDDTGTSFQIAIPSDHQAPTGRRLEADYRVELKEIGPETLGGIGRLKSSDSPRERKTILRGEAILVEGDGLLVLNIPVEHQAPTGRRLRVPYIVKLEEDDAEVVSPGVLSWNNLTQNGWNCMTQSQWNQMVQ
jgi:hypothetical protein